MRQQLNRGTVSIRQRTVCQPQSCSKSDVDLRKSVMTHAGPTYRLCTCNYCYGFSENYPHFLSAGDTSHTYGTHTTGSSLREQQLRQKSLFSPLVSEVSKQDVRFPLRSPHCLRSGGRNSRPVEQRLSREKNPTWDGFKSPQ